MSAEVTIVIDDYDVSERTGHVMVTVHTHTVDENASWDGPKKQYSVDLQMYRDRFNSNIEQFEAWVAAEHRVLTGPPPGLSEALAKRKGVVIG